MILQCNLCNFLSSDCVSTAHEHLHCLDCRFMKVAVSSVRACVCAVHGPELHNMVGDDLRSQGKSAGGVGPCVGSHSPNKWNTDRTCSPVQLLVHGANRHRLRCRVLSA